MSFEIRPPGVPGTYDASGGPSAQPIARRTPSADFARVYELEEVRSRREVGAGPLACDRIPDEVWDEVDAAARLFESLQSTGRRMMFDTDRLSGKVVASLLEPDGGLGNVPLADAVDPKVAASRLQARGEQGAA